MAKQLALSRLLAVAGRILEKNARVKKNFLGNGSSLA
jgi:hypothetical protein